MQTYMIKECPKPRFPIGIIVFDKLELILLCVSQGLTLSTETLEFNCIYHLCTALYAFALVFVLSKISSVSFSDTLVTNDIIIEISNQYAQVFLPKIWIITPDSDYFCCCAVL